MEENKIFISLGVLAAVGYGYYAWNKSRKNDLALRAVERLPRRKNFYFNSMRKPTLQRRVLYINNSR